MNELLVIENLLPADVFKERGGDPIIERIKQEVLAVDRDMTTPEGRKGIASLAHKVARSKTLLDEMGKTFASDLKKQTKAIDNERARIWDALEALQKEVRQPLTEFEEKEKARVEKHKADLVEIENGGKFSAENWHTISVEAMQDRLAEIKKEGECDREEFTDLFRKTIDDASKQISSAIEKRQKHDAEQEELRVLRLKEEERLRHERDKKIRAEAAEAARKQVEEKAAKEAKEVAEKAEAERRKIEQEKRDAEAREQKAIADAKAAEEKAKRNQEAAVKAERDKIEAQKKAEAEAAEKREADTKHRAKVNNAAKAAIDDIVNSVVNDSKIAELVVIAIAKGQIPNVKIFY